MNHTSDKHKWFIESSAARKTNPKGDWYVWNDGIPANSPNLARPRRRMARARWFLQTTGPSDLRKALPGSGTTREK